MATTVPAIAHRSGTPSGRVPRSRHRIAHATTTTTASGSAIGRVSPRAITTAAAPHHRRRTTSSRNATSSSMLNDSV